MSLRVWIPFNREISFTENKGLDEITYVSGELVNATNGKLGPCCASINNTISLNWIYPESETNAITICAWVKGVVTLFNKNNFTLGINTSLSNAMVESKYNTTTSTSGTIPSADIDNWHHIIVYIVNRAMQVYVDGNYCGMINILGAAVSWGIINNGVNTFIIGAQGQQGYINDFRIYDHRLSLLEINELRKGLIFHQKFNYKLSDNLFQFDNGIYTHENSYNSVSSSTDAVSTGCKVWADVIPGQTYIFSIATDREISSYHGGYKKCTVWLYLYENEISWTTTNAVYQLFTTSHATYKKLGSNRYSWIYTIPEGRHKCCVRVNHYSDGTTSMSSKWWDFRLYEANVNINDSSGYDIIPDSNGSLEVNVGSPRYDTCVQFNQNYITLSRDLMVTDSITINHWVYLDTWNATNFGRTISCTEGGGWNFEGQSNLQFPVFTNGKYLTASVAYSSLSSGWHMLTGSFNGVTTSLYVDGILKHTNTQATKYPITYNTTNGIFIGAKAGVNQYEPTSDACYFTGKLSDIRIYATCLSAEDIKDLYNVSTIIDNTGNLLTHDLQEYNKNIFTPENLNEEVFNKITYKNPVQYSIRNGQAAFALNPEWFYLRPTGGTASANTSTLGNYFITSKQYKLDLWIDADDILYQDANVPGGIRVYYTDGTTSDACVINGNKNSPLGFQHKVYYTDKTKTVKGIYVYYYTPIPAYYRADSSITAVDDVEQDIKKIGITKVEALNEIISDNVLKIYDNKFEVNKLNEY